MNPSDTNNSKTTSTNTIATTVASTHNNSNPDCILVNPNQKGNKLLKHIRSTSWRFANEISPAHYVMGNACCALFLSLKYHVIYPNYIYDQLTALGKTYQLRVLIVLMDHIEYNTSLTELTKLAIRTDCTLMLTWSYEEAANYLDTYKSYIGKSADIIMGKQMASSSDDESTYQCLVEALSSVKSINKTDAESLVRIFDSFDKIASANEMTMCPGMGLQKAERFRQFMNKPFKRDV